MPSPDERLTLEERRDYAALAWAVRVVQAEVEAAERGEVVDPYAVAAVKIYGAASPRAIDICRALAPARDYLGNGVWRAA